MKLAWSPDDLAFRDEVRAFLGSHLTEDLRAAGQGMTSVYAEHDASMAWQRILHAKGWVAPAWPRRYGGGEWTVLQRYIWARERAAAGAPPLSPMGVSMCGPALIGHGTEEQKARFLPPMLSGDHVWCQAYSEAGAGSDLAALQMAAEDDGDHLVCTGVKLWSTHAHLANWCFCLVRTSREDRPQRGITFLLIPMELPGITVRPIVMLSGEHIQNQIVFDAVRVPKANIVGRAGEGWTVAKYLLEFERGGTAYAPELHERLHRLASQAGPALTDDPAFRRKLTEARSRVLALEHYEFRSMCGTAANDSIAPSMMKILGTELQQRVTELAQEAAGLYGAAYQPSVGRPGGEVVSPHSTGVVGPTNAALAPLRYLNERAASIYAGSNEIQRNIIAKALGL